MIAPTVFIVRGEPVPKARPRASFAGGVGTNSPAGIHIRTPAQTKRYEQNVKSAAAKAHGNKPLFSGALNVITEFRMPIPESWSATKKALAAQELIYHTSKPDKDNLEKAVFDACNGVIWKDDALIVSGSFKKLYHYEPCVIVTVEALETGDSDTP